MINRVLSGFRSKPVKMIGKYVLPAFFILLILVAQNMPAAAEWYGLHIYPLVAAFLAWVASFVPFSLYDLFLTLVVLGFVVLFLLMLFRFLTWRRGVSIIFFTLVWLVIGFYFCWGLNYYRPGFYARHQIVAPEVDRAEFKAFASRYIAELNENFLLPVNVDKSAVYDEVLQQYNKLAPALRLVVPPRVSRTKEFMYSRLMASMGIKGYIGVYFNEPLINNYVLSHQYPFTCAHEMAHVFGVSNEAEANFYAFIACSGSSDPVVRFSAYAALFPFVMSSARRVLSASEYAILVSKVRTEMWSLYNFDRRYWTELYSPALGDVQDRVYDWFLKGNRITAGVANYGEVTGYLLAYRQQMEKPGR